jgi:hypothetical protein
MAWTLIAAVLFQIAANDLSQDRNVTLLAPPGSKLQETSLAASGNRALITVINRITPEPIQLFVSNDAAATWSAAGQLPMTFGGRTWAYATDPTAAVLDDRSFGVAYLVTALTPSPRSAAPNETAVAFTRSLDGVTWSTPVIVTSGPSLIASYADRPWLSVDHTNGALYLTWTGVVAGTMSTPDFVLTKSTDRGATWSAPAVGQPVTGHDILPQLASIGGTMAVTVVDTSRAAYLAKVSSDGGATFAETQVIGTGVPTTFTAPRTKTWSPPLPSLVAWRDVLHCAYPSSNGVFYSRSLNSGRTWSAPLQLGGANGDAVLPVMAVNDATGEVFVAWLDSRDDATGATMRLYAVHSTDSGASFDAPRPFSSPFKSGGDLGDTNGAAAIAPGLAVTAFEAGDGSFVAARIEYAPPRRRTARH